MDWDKVMHVIAENATEEIGYVNSIPVLRIGSENPTISKQGTQFLTKENKIFFCVGKHWVKKNN